MYDFHYDLLTRIYLAYKKDDYKKLKKFCKKHYKNIKGGIINLYFMSPKEMKEELDIEYNEYNPELKGVITMLSIINQKIKKYNLLPPNHNFIYGIEGCDYIKIDDLEILYKLGLRSINLVWNNENIYGSGIKSNKGLTKLGKKFLIKAIDLGIGIDLSHMNKLTFDDTIALIKDQQQLNKKINVYASHSNVKKLCNHQRNLTDGQIKKIKSVNGHIGLFSHREFVDTNNLSTKKAALAYIKHIKYVENLLGGLDNIIISTDDMNFYQNSNSPIFPNYKIKQKLTNLLLKNYSIDDVNKIMINNAQKIINNLNKTEKII